MVAVVSKEFDHPKKGLIHIQNINDNQYINQATVRKVGKDFVRKPDFKDITFKIFIQLKKTILSGSVFLVMEKEKNIQSMGQKILSKDMLIYYL